MVEVVALTRSSKTRCIWKMNRDVRALPVVVMYYIDGWHGLAVNEMVGVAG